MNGTGVLKKKKKNLTEIPAPYTEDTTSDWKSTVQKAFNRTQPIGILILNFQPLQLCEINLYCLSLT